MKKLGLIIAAVAMLSLGVNAQEMFSKGTKLFKVGLGFNSNGKPIAASYEVGVANGLFGVEKLNLGLGGYLGYYGYKQTTADFGATYTWKYKIIAPGVGGYAHYQFINKLDTYLGVMLGLSVQKASLDGPSAATVDPSGVDFAWGLVGGARYEFNSNWGAFIEGGHATGNFTLGVAYKF
jgi:hypothetical protein